MNYSMDTSSDAFWCHLPINGKQGLYRGYTAYCAIVWCRLRYQPSLPLEGKVPEGRMRCNYFYVIRRKKEWVKF